MKTYECIEELAIDFSIYEATPNAVSAYTWVSLQNIAPVLSRFDNFDLGLRIYERLFELFGEAQL